MRLRIFYFLFCISVLSATVCALTEDPLENVTCEQPEIKTTILPANDDSAKSEETKPSEQLIEVQVETQGHENVGERKTRQFGYPGFGYRPIPYRPFYGGGFGGGFGGGYGGGFGGGYGGGFQRTRIVTRTRVVNRVRGGGGYYGGGFYG